MLKKSIIAIPFFIYSLTMAQNVEILQFETQTYDFGYINEMDGPVTYEFIFRNNGKEPISITEVKASCGCTTPGWTREVVLPGGEGFVKAQYNPYNRPGTFHKDLTIYTDLEGETTKLYIKGYVKPKPMSVEEEFPVALGDLHMKYSILNMGKAFTQEEPATKSFEIFNAGEKDIIVRKIQAPEHVYVQLPDTLKAGEKSEIMIAYDVLKKGELGFFSENISLTTNEPEDSIKSLTIFTNVLEYFPPVPKSELGKLPRLSFGEQVFDFNSVKEGEKVSTTFELKNNGGSVLNIRKLEPNCTCVTANLNKNDLAPGESTTIDVTFETSGRKGSQQKAITVYSNDPMGSVQRLTVKGNVE